MASKSPFFNHGINSLRLEQPHNILKCQWPPTLPRNELSSQPLEGHSRQWMQETHKICVYWWNTKTSWHNNSFFRQFHDMITRKSRFSTHLNQQCQGCHHGCGRSPRPRLSAVRDPWSFCPLWQTPRSPKVTKKSQNSPKPTMPRVSPRMRAQPEAASFSCSGPVIFLPSLTMLASQKVRRYKLRMRHSVESATSSTPYPGTLQTAMPSSPAAWKKIGRKKIVKSS